MESIKLNLIPSDNTKPVCHASQYDIGRSIRLELYDGDFPYILSDETIELDVKKGDGNVITTDLDFEVGDAYVDMITTEQMTAIAGQNFCELKISKDAAVIYTKNFILKVEQSVLEGGIQSESEINNLETQIAGLVEEAVENQYDSENVIFDSEPTAGHGTGYTVTSSGLKTALDAKADASDLPDMTQYYTKTATDTLLDAKADKATTYTKTETDTALASKANAADVYTKAQVDTIAEAKADASDVYDKNTIDEKMAEKADIDGEYDQLTAGLAKQIKSSVGNEDKTPYLFRTAGGSIDIGDREEDTIIGATMAFNQLVQNGNFSDTTGWGSANATQTASGNILSITKTGPTGYGCYRQFLNMPLNHKVLRMIDIKGASGVTYYFNTHLPTVVATGSWQTIATIKTFANSTIYFNVTTSEDGDYQTVQIANLMFIDLTQMFGPTIADYIYNLENSTAGAGVAWLKNHGFMTKPYYPYNAGQLISVKTSKHITRGFNAWDEEWEFGNIDDTTGQNDGEYTGAWRSKNYIKILPETQYCHMTDGYNGNFRHFFYDANKNYIKVTIPTASDSKALFTTPKNAYFMRFRYYTTLTNYKNCINLHWDGERDGEYEPYVKHEYPLDGTKEWRGLFKLDANNKLYADGDRYPSDGQAERRFAIVDLGSLEWIYSDASGHERMKAILSDWKRPANNNTAAVGITVPFGIITAVGTYNHTEEGIAKESDSNSIFVYTSTMGTDATAFKNSMNGKYLVYEKATPTAETAAAYTNPQLVDDFGTEEYEDTRDIPVPVGHETMYQANLRAKLEMAPESPSGNGDYLVRQTDGQNEYVAFTKELPVAPTTNGNYQLKLTVSGGTPSLSWEAIT